MQKPNITVLGDGAWGTAISQLLANNNYQVTLWCNNKKIADDIKLKKENLKYLPGIQLSNLIEPVTDLHFAINKSKFVFEAIPVKFLRKVLKKINIYNKKSPWIVLSKGIENNSNLFSSQIIKEVLGPVPVAVLSGPSFAIELAKKQPTSVIISSKNIHLANKIKDIVDNTFFKSHYDNDILGVEIGGALKNIITIAVGLLDSLGYKENTKAFIITEGLKEISLLAKKLGAKKETIYNLSGLGDLILTSLGSKSKNLKFGQLLGQNKKLKEIKKILPTLPEGINSAKSIYQISKKHNLNIPICLSVYNIIYEGISPHILIDKLFNASSTNK